MKISIVVGLNYGDEGKGATVNALCKYPKKTLVIRFNGGHQCGHTVVHNNIRHPFSNFGSGTLKGVPTYWTEYCTVNPPAVLKEGNVLREQGINPVVIYNANAMITTPYDILHNITSKNNLNHGTVGVGFGKTIQRNEDFYHLYVRDLLYPAIRDEKLNNIRTYTYNRTNDERFHDNRFMEKIMDEFKIACDHLVQNFQIVNTFKEIQMWNHYLIFEGGQGIMLDMDYGFFPYATYSNATSKNAIALIQKWGIENRLINTYYVTRAYQTRHGNGFMSNEDLDNSFIKINPNETNVDTGTQGKFRRAMLDLEQLKYALSCDLFHNHPESKKNLIITCYDHVGEAGIPITHKYGNIMSLNPKQIAERLNIFKVFTSNSDKGILDI
jgi:adenylosuccinate synthase